MVLASHIIFAAYGFWLPNDPRGSWSDFVGSWDLLQFGPATKTCERRSLARDNHDQDARLAAKRALKYPPVQFTGIQARAIGRGFDAFVRKNGVTIWACAILPDHVHLVVARHRYEVEQLVNLLKGAATRSINAVGIHPLATCKEPHESRPPRMWARGLWKVFLSDNDAIERAIRYVRMNPIRAGLPAQRWSCVVPFPPESASLPGRGST